MCGYGNALTFKDLDDSDISAVEQFIKQKTFMILSKNVSEKIGKHCEALVSDEQLEEYFGPIYKHTYGEFEFRSGDVKLIKQIAAYVKNTVDGNGTNSGIQMFMPKRLPQKRKIEKTLKENNEIAHNATICEVEMTDPEPLVSLKSSLFKKTVECLKSYGADELIDVENIDPDSISDSIENGKITGHIYWAICEKNPKKKKQKAKRVSYYTGKSSQYWISSNFTTHLKLAHELSGEKRQPKQKSPKEIIDKENMKLEHNEMDQSLVIVKVSLPKLTITQDQLYHQISHQITKMAKFILTNNENECVMNVKLSDTDARAIKVVESPGNGNCLFTSLAHQLFGYSMNSQEMKEACKKLRADVVDHIQKNIEDFKHEITGRGQDSHQEKNRNGDESEVSFDIDKECVFFIHQLLPRNKYWGGSETLKAVSYLHKVNVYIFNENTTCNIVYAFGKSYEKTISVAYRVCLNDQSMVLRNHYEKIR